MARLRSGYAAYVLIFVIIALLFGGIWVNQVGAENITFFIKKNPALGMLVYFSYSVLSTVVISLPVIPLWPVALTFFGFLPALLLTLTGVVIGSTISFFLARKYGRPIVVKMLGKTLFTQIETFTNVSDVKTFFVLRLFGSNYFDAISYIAGLSKIEYRQYISITTITSFIWLLLVFYLVERVGRFGSIESLVAAMGVYGLIVILGSLLWKFLQNSRKKRK